MWLFVKECFKIHHSSPRHCMEQLKNPKPVSSFGLVLELFMMKYHQIHPENLTSLFYYYLFIYSCITAELSHLTGLLQHVHV
jgi:hypothetical protein